MIREILTAPNPLLEQVAEEVDRDEIIGGIVEDMFETMRKTVPVGVGLAAPQIGVSKRIVVLDLCLQDPPVGDGPVLASFGAKKGLILVNPVITPVGDAKRVGSEECLSVPGMHFNVERWAHVKVEAMGPESDDEPLVFYAHEWFAAVMQHEVAHLDGETLHQYITNRQQRRQYEKQKAKVLKQRARARA